MAKRGKKRGKTRSYNRRTPQEHLEELEAQLEDLKQEVRDQRKFSPDAVYAERERIGLSAENYAHLVGVTAATIYNWERGGSEPRAAQLAHWLSVRGIGKREAWKRLGLKEAEDRSGFSPDAMYAERDRLELSAADYGELVGVSALTIYNWEKGRTSPQRAQLEKWQAVRGIGKRKAWKRLGLT